jgi:hypothetical protein
LINKNNNFASTQIAPLKNKDKEMPYKEFTAIIKNSVKDQVSVEITNSINDKITQNILYSIYIDGFSQNDESAMCQICYAKKAFFQALENEDIQKFVLYKNKLPVGAALAATTIEAAEAGFINTLFYKKLFNQVSGDNFYYITTIFVDKANYSFTLIKHFIISIMDYCFQNYGLFSFDLSENNSRYIGKVVEGIAKKHKYIIDGGIVDKQTTYAFWRNKT